MPRSGRTKLWNLAIAIGAIAGAAIGILIAGGLYFLGDNTAAIRDDLPYASVLIVAGFALGGAFYGYSAYRDSKAQHGP